MQNFPLWKQILILGICAAGILVALPNVFYGRVERANDARAALAAGAPATPELSADAAGWPRWLPSRLINLGLDLRGGAHVLVQVETADVYTERMEGLWPMLRDQLRDLRDQVGTVRRLNGPADELHIRVGNPDGVAAALAAVQAAAQPVFSLTGGSSREFDVRAEGDTLVVTLTPAEKTAIDGRTMQQSLEIIRRRVDETGTREPSIQRQGSRPHPRAGAGNRLGRRAAGGHRQDRQALVPTGR